MSEDIRQSLDLMKPSSMKESVANKPYVCHECRNPIAVGTTVLWVRLKQDDKEHEMFPDKTSAWRHRPFHHSCYDKFEAQLYRERDSLEAVDNLLNYEKCVCCGDPAGDVRHPGHPCDCAYDLCPGKCYELGMRGQQPEDEENLPS